MSESNQTSGVRPIDPEELPTLLGGVPLLADLGREGLECFRGADLMTVPSGATVIAQGEGPLYFWVLLEGRIRAYKENPESPDGSDTFLMEFASGETAGEVPLLLGQTSPSARCEATQDCKVVRVSEAGFWKLMASCPVVRAGVLKDMTRRFELYQAITLHREKLISLGTLAAGLMHELNNPGAAAKRAAAQLRENMTRLQAITLRFTRTPLSAEQLECLGHLQEKVFSLRREVELDSLEQSDRAEELSTWLEDLGVENSWQLAPTMVSVGWERDDIACAQSAFPAQVLSDTLNYLEALISSVQLVGTIEESISRVTDLVTAVKKYAYDDKSRHQKIDVRDSLMSTLTILGHKFRGKQLRVEKDFSEETLTVSCMGSGLTQVWTNLLDNAIDAAPEGSSIGVRLWQEADSVCVGIVDHGPGIPEEHWEHIYQPFFTTKEVGVGTGLGLDIAHRIVVSNFQGDISFTSEPGHTEFVVRLPKVESCTVAAAQPA
ncbi:MAG TPA: ATP-binding protein [Acidobacteriaceae bacterium]